MRALIGDTDLAAIEYETEEPRDEKWLFGRFLLHVRGEEIGNWDDVVTLSAVVAWWRSFVDSGTARWDQRLEGLSPSEVFETLRDAAYSDDDAREFGDAFARFHVNQLGMSSFDPFAVILVEPPGQDQWLLWRREARAASVHHARLPAGTLQTIGAKFVRDIE